MQEKNLFEYAVIRIVPRVEREEFLNVGVVLYCAPKKFLGMLYNINVARLKSLCGDCDTNLIDEYLKAFEQICNGLEEAAPIGKLPAAERFRWLSARRSTVVQTSKVHPGFCNDPAEMLQKLFNQLVN